jgi:hypothetical protein
MVHRLRQKFDQQRLDLIHQCETALPVFARRYQHLDALLKLCQKQDGWQPPELSRPPAFIPQAPDDSISRLTLPESAPAWSIEEAMDHFTNGRIPFEKVMGVLTIHELLEGDGRIAMEITNLEVVKKSTVLAQYEADLAATDVQATQAIGQIEQTVAGYDDNFFARWLQIQPILRDSCVVPPEQ